jgi:glycosyltransferase involved in cell wall biosynthesis
VDTKNTPRISIGLPVFNGAKYLADALDSLVAQTFSDFEIIISDNASTDATAEICRDYAAKDPRIKYHRSEVNRGAAWNFNNTFNLSRGEYFRWAAHDDFIHPEFLDKCVSFLDRNESHVLCFTRTVFIDEHDNEFKEHTYPLDLAKVSRKKLFMHYVCAHHINTEIFGLIRSDILGKTRLIDGFVGSDFVLLGELVFYGPFYQIPEILFTHREHSGRSTKATKGPEEYTQWFDSSKKIKFAMPYWRRLYECSVSVMRHPVSLSDKMGYLIEIGRAAKWNHSALGAEIIRASKRLF